MEYKLEMVVFPPVPPATMNHTLLSFNNIWADSTTFQSLSVIRRVLSVVTTQTYLFSKFQFCTQFKALFLPSPKGWPSLRSECFPSRHPSSREMCSESSVPSPSSIFQAKVHRCAGRLRGSRGWHIILAACDVDSYWSFLSSWVRFSLLLGSSLTQKVEAVFLGRCCISLHLCPWLRMPSERGQLWLHVVSASGPCLQPSCQMGHPLTRCHLISPKTHASHSAFSTSPVEPQEPWKSSPRPSMWHGGYFLCLLRFLTLQSLLYQLWQTSRARKKAGTNFTFTYALTPATHVKLSSFLSTFSSTPCQR